MEFPNGAGWLGLEINYSLCFQHRLKHILSSSISLNRSPDLAGMVDTLEETEKLILLQQINVVANSPDPFCTSFSASCFVLGDI